MKIILASKSPRRRDLLTQIGLDYEYIPSDREEKILSSIPSEVAEGLSAQKAEDVYERLCRYYCGKGQYCIWKAD